MGYDNRTALPENHNLIINDLNTGNTYSVTIEKEIGRGGSCVVYKGTQKDWVGNERITRSVIIKEFYPKALDSLVSRSSESMDLNISEEAQELYEDRLALFCSGQAKHIIYANENAGRSLPPVSFSGYAHNTFYAVSNQGQGVTLSELNRDNISLTELLSISVSVCDAINAIHSNGMKLYLDLKPDNIYVFDNRGFLFDFDTVQPKERLRFSSYSDGWSAPEQVFNDDSGYINTKKIGFHTDIYSIGAVLFYLLVGRKPSSEELKRINEKAFDWQNEITLPKSENALKDEVFVSELSRIMQEILESDADIRKLSFGNLDAALKLKHELEHLISLVENAPYRQGFEDTIANINIAKDEILAVIKNENKKYNDEVLETHPQDRYEGETLDGVPNGTGIYYLANGDRYEGSFESGKPSGEITYYYTDNNSDINKIEGIFDGFGFPCFGTVYYSNGDRYIGELLDGIPCGTGVTYYKNGETYYGAFVDGKSNGLGIYNRSNGDIYSGVFKDGSIIKGVYYYHQSGGVYEG